MSKSKSNIATAPLTIEAENLSVAWSKILLKIIDNPGTEIAPLVVSLTGRGGSVYLNRFRGFLKWISAFVMPPPELVLAG